MQSLLISFQSIPHFSDGPLSEITDAVQNLSCSLCDPPF